MCRLPVVAMALCFAVAPFAFSETAHSPGSDRYASWEPFVQGADGLGNRAFQALQAEIDTPHTQGYKLQRRFTNPQAAPDAGDCTRANWDIFAQGVGIALIHTHGFTHSIIGVSTSNGAVADAWAAGGADNRGMVVRFSLQFNSYIVRVRSGWFQRNFAPFFNNTESIVYLGGCETALASEPDEKTVLASVGGRCALGYTNRVKVRDVPKDITNLFQYMNGLEPSISLGLWRLASLAVAAPGYSPGFDSIIYGETTLCPSVAKPTLSDISPHGSGAAQSGDGKIVFDTKVDTVHVSATDALTFRVSGTVDITNVHWNGDHEIDFHWDATSSSGGYGSSFSVTATAVASKVIAFPAGQQLDGGDLASNENAFDGFAPNGDDFTWTFSN